MQEFLEDKKGVYTGRICPYCGKPTEYVDSREVYSKSYGMIYRCRACEAWVDVHKGTDKVLDIYPGNRKYHDLTNNQRGDYRNLTQFLNRFFENV